MSTAQHTPIRVDKYSDQEMILCWTTQEEFSLPYIELRFACPCAGCVDERTGKRTLQRESLDPAVKPAQVSAVGRYALNIRWSDGHGTGLYHFDRLYDLCRSKGRALKKSIPTSKMSAPTPERSPLEP